MACGVQEKKKWALKLKLVSTYTNNQAQIESLWDFLNINIEGFSNKNWI